MPFGDRRLDEIIVPEDANRWDLAFTLGSGAVQKKDFTRAHGTALTSGTGAAFSVVIADYALVDMAGFNAKLHADAAYGATINVNGSGGKPIYTSDGQVVSPNIKAGSIVTLIYNATNDRFYLLGAGGGGEVVATATGTGAALVVSASGYVMADMRSILVKLPADIQQGATINVNSVGAKPIYTCAGRPIHAGMAVQGSMILLTYNAGQNRFYAIGVSDMESTTIIDAEIKKEFFVGDGAKTVFTFTNGQYDMGGNRLLVVSVGGAVQHVGTDYAESSKTSITFSEAPASGAIVEVVYIQNFYGDLIDAGEF